MNSENTAPGMDPGLAAAAAGIATPGAPAAAPGTAAAPAGPVVTNWHQEAKALWSLVSMLSMRYPSVRPVYTDEVLEQLATAWAPVLERHNFDMGKWMIYFTAGCATMPVLAQTVNAIRDDRAHDAEAKAVLDGKPA